jgi:anti-sigma factor RsiW
MPCEHYKDALIEAAASGSTPQGDLRAHLAGCTSCRSAFLEVQSLFAAIDSGIHAIANAEVPASVLPRLRVAPNQAARPGLRWVRPLVFASAGVALASVMLLFVRSRDAAPGDIAKLSPGSVAPLAASATTTNPEKSARESTRVAAVRVGHSHTAQDSTRLHPAASSNSEVLVPPDEREAFARLVAVLNEHGDVASGLLAKVPQKDAPVTGEPPKIPDIEIKPLDGTEGETSDGVVDKH